MTTRFIKRISGFFVIVTVPLIVVASFPCAAEDATDAVQAENAFFAEAICNPGGTCRKLSPLWRRQ